MSGTISADILRLIGTFETEGGRLILEKDGSVSCQFDDARLEPMLAELRRHKSVIAEFLRGRARWTIVPCWHCKEGKCECVACGEAGLPRPCKLCRGLGQLKRRVQ